MKRYQHLMVALARAEGDTELLAYAGMLANRLRPGKIDFVHVLPDADAESEDEPGGDQGSAAQEIQDRVRSSLGDVEGVETVCHILRGPLMDRLLEFVAERGTEMILVGHRKQRGGRRALARRLATKAPCSIWMAPEGSPAQLDRILIPIDFSERSADALATGTALAASCGIKECTALHVFTRTGIMSYEDYDEKILKAQQDQEFSRFIGSIDRSGVKVVPRFEEGQSVPEVICRVAEEEKADLVVMATRGRTRAASILLGSEAEQTIIETKGPILAVKHFGERMSLLQVLLDRNFGRVPGPRFD